MKRKYLLLVALLCSLLFVLSACDAREIGSVKSLTRPYIAQYECTDATLGNENLLDKFDYIKIILQDKKQLNLVYKLKNSEQHTVESEYSFDLDTRELSAEIGILGYKFKQKTVVENGKFTISKTIGTKQLIMKFEAV